jgi:hypothetical protein
MVASICGRAEARMMRTIIFCVHTVLFFPTPKKPIVTRGQLANHLRTRTRSHHWFLSVSEQLQPTDFLGCDFSILNSGEEEIRNNEDNNRTVLGRAAMVKIQEHGRFLSIDILQQERCSFVNRLIVHLPSDLYQELESREWWNSSLQYDHYLFLLASSCFLY